MLYVYIGNSVESLSFLSLPPVWSKIAFGVALGNFLMSVNTLITHTAMLIFFLAEEVSMRIPLQNFSSFAFSDTHDTYIHIHF